MRSKKIKLECYTADAAIHKLFPISSAKKFIPEWFKSIPPMVEQVENVGLKSDMATIKHCDGFNNLYKRGWVIPMWSDLLIETDEEGRYKYQYSGSFDSVPTPKDPVVHHSSPQLGNKFPDHIHLKLLAPWIIKEKTGVDFYFSENTWGMEKYFDDITILPGVLNFKNQNSANINLFLERKNNKFLIEHNTPLIHCIPLSESKLEIENHLVSDQEFKHLSHLASYNFSFTGTYKKEKSMWKIK